MPVAPRRLPVRMVLVAVVAALAGCDVPPAASDPFNDAAIAALGAFDDEQPDVLVTAFEQLELEVDDSLDLKGGISARSLIPSRLTEADVDGMEHPSRDPALTLPVALAWSSPAAAAEHDPLALLKDQVGVEPFATAYARTFTEGESCYPADCEFLRSRNEMTKENIEMTVSLVLMKDWRAFDLSDGRAARASRGWMEAGADASNNADRIEQSFAIELWTEQTDGSTLRLLVLWAETTFESPKEDDLVMLTTRIGMDTLFHAHDDWIEENP